ncbi:DUF559 domain-containing protein [Corynebacterium sp. Q4381]|uniref:DUF559 domain-containing protein n=1 Tax=Corynebacterium sp. Marseille-Q4381 TaxID=3121597 RepID=UPI002FE5B27A
MTTQRQQEIRNHIVDLRRLSHAQATELSGGYTRLDPSIVYPTDMLKTLAYHERRWLEVEAAAMTSRGAVLVSRSAARKLGMWVIALDSELVELALRSRAKCPSRGSRRNIVYRRSQLLDSEIEEIDGHPTTTPFRTFADIARYHSFAEGLIAADYLRRNGYTLEQLRGETIRLGRLKGIATVRECVAHSVDNSDSAYESFARALLIQAGIGPITTQYEINGYFADILIGNWLIIEIDGNVKYEGPDAEAVRQREFNRQKRIGNMGYVFLRFSPDFIRNHPDEFIAQVRQAIAARAAMLAK